MKIAIVFFTVLFITSSLAPDNVLTRFKIPEGYQQIAVQPGSFGAYLQSLPLKPTGTHTLTYRGAIGRNSRCCRYKHRT